MGLVDTTRVETLEVPHEPGEWIGIRHLLATEMDEAREVRMKHILDLWGDSLPNTQQAGDAKVWGRVMDELNQVFADVELPPEVEKGVSAALARVRREETEEDEETLAQRAAQYDALTLLKYAVVSWSYDAPVRSGSLEHVELLDTVTRDWLVEQVVQRNTRPLGSRRHSNGSLSLGESRESYSGLTASEGRESN